MFDVGTVVQSPAADSSGRFDNRHFKARNIFYTDTTAGPAHPFARESARYPPALPALTYVVSVGWEVLVVPQGLMASSPGFQPSGELQ